VRKQLFFLWLLFCLSACAPKPPTFEEDPTLLPAEYHFATSLQEVELPDPWWKSFHDPLLDQLIQELLENNPSLLEASSRLEEAMALEKAARARRFPRLDFSFSARRRKTADYLVLFGSSVTGEFSGSLVASYEVDLWQKLSRAEKAARLRVLALEEERKALAQSLIAELVTRYFQARYLNCRLAVVQEELAVQETFLKALRLRYERGLVSASTLEQEERLYAALEMLVPEIEQQRSRLLQEISVLLGRYPQPLAQEERGCSLDLPPPPPGLPSELLLRRPDIRAARAQVLAAAQEVASRRAARFPRLTLTGTEGRLSNALKTLLQGNHRFWELAANLTQPIFDAGELKAQEKAAQARFRQAEAKYVRTLLQAFFEVETGLLGEEKEREKWLLAKRQERAASLEEKILFERYVHGLVPSLDYLKMKHLRLERQRERLGAELALLLNRISLYRALGGAWPLEESAPPGPPEEKER